MNELTYEPQFKASATFGKITGRVADKCKQCGRPFERPLMDLTGKVGERTVGGCISTLICPICQDKITSWDRNSDGELYETNPGELRGRQPAFSRPWEAICAPKYADVQFDLLPDAGKKHFEEIMGWAATVRRDSPQGLGLVGPSDRGKSMLIHEVAKAFFITRWEIHLTFATQFALDMADTNKRAGELERCCTTQWLLIDDIGKEKMTERVESDLYHVLEVRERWRRPLLCTVNSSGEDLAENMSSDRGLPIVNRLRRLCKFISIK